MVFAHAIDAAKKYTVDREEWIKAATRFRLPFWDWGLNAFPPKEFYDVDNAAKVEIVDYDGTTTSVQNPLLSYSFAAKHGPLDPEHHAYYDVIAKFPSTLRHPTQPYDESSKSNVEDLETYVTEDIALGEGSTLTHRFQISQGLRPNYTR